MICLWVYFVLKGVQVNGGVRTQTCSHLCVRTRARVCVCVCVFAPLQEAFQGAAPLVTGYHFGWSDAGTFKVWLPTQPNHIAPAIVLSPVPLCVCVCVCVCFQLWATCLP